jgi:signal transduction histidine kinase
MLEKLMLYFKYQEKALKENRLQDYTKTTKQIKRFYKRTPAYFNRITENTNRLLYEGENELKELLLQIQKEKNQYTELEIFIIICIILLVFILSYLTARQINANTKKIEIQEASTRGILDGQPNIVVVSNGEEMVDANTALIDFFRDYDDFSAFSDKHLCICDFFVDIGDEQFVVDKDYNGKRWHEYIIHNSHLVHKAAMYNQFEELSYFTITAKRKDLSDNKFLVIISLNDISKEIDTQKELQELNDSLEDIVKEKTKELTHLNENLEIRIKKELKKNRQKDKKMIQQSRFAALGEMIGNIAHQWRQPLSAISSTASSQKLQLELGINNNHEIRDSYDSINSYVEFLSQTIEDFRLFFKEDKEEYKFNMISILKNTIPITSAVYKDSNINIKMEIIDSELTSFGLPNELSQVFLNILNNAKDALKKSNNALNEVLIKTYTTDTHNIIEILDNAGGIPANIKTKIFDPYFTTKHQSQGTGIGLFMCKEIVEKHMKGTLSVQNKFIKVQNITYDGACFTVSLPKYDF